MRKILCKAKFWGNNQKSNVKIKVKEMGKFSLEIRRFGEWGHKSSPQIPKR